MVTTKIATTMFVYLLFCFCIHGIKKFLTLKNQRSYLECHGKNNNNINSSGKLIELSRSSKIVNTFYIIFIFCLCTFKLHNKFLFCYMRTFKLHNKCLFREKL